MNKPMSCPRLLALAITISTVLSLSSVPVFAQENSQQAQPQPQQPQQVQQPQQQAQQPQQKAQTSEDENGWSPMQAWMTVEFYGYKIVQLFLDPTPNNLIYATLQSYYPDTKVVSLGQLMSQYKENLLKTNNTYNNKRVLVLGFVKSVNNVPGGIVELNLATGKDGDEDHIAYLRSMKGASAIADILRKSPYAAVNCQYASADKGFVLRDCECSFEPKAAIEQSLIEVRDALDGRCENPLAVIDAVQVQNIVDKISDEKLYPGEAEKCVPFESNCSEIVKKILDSSTVLKDKKEFTEILKKLGYSQDAANKYWDFAQKGK